MALAKPEETSWYPVKVVRVRESENGVVQMGLAFEFLVSPIRSRIHDRRSTMGDSLPHGTVNARDRQWSMREVTDPVAEL